MKHGKKYTDAAKLVDRSVQYDTAEAIALVKKAVTGVMPSSRSAVRWYCRTEPVRA